MDHAASLRRGELALSCLQLRVDCIPAPHSSGHKQDLTRLSSSQLYASWLSQLSHFLHSFLHILGESFLAQLRLTEPRYRATVPLALLARVYRFMHQHGRAQARAVSRWLAIKLAQQQYQCFLVVEKDTSCTASLAGALLQGYCTSYPAPEGVPLRAPA